MTELHFSSPKTWAIFEPDADYIAEAFEARAVQRNLDSMHPSNATFTEALVQWTKACEDSVGDALKKQHQNDTDRFPQPNLPSACRGRMLPPRQTKQPPKFAIKKACEGQCTPQIQVANYKILHRVKQTRWLESFEHRLKKLPANPTLPRDLWVEWKAISKSPGFKSFPVWCANIPKLRWFPLDFPTAEYVGLLITFLKHHTDDLIYHYHSNNNKLGIFKSR